MVLSAFVRGVEKRSSLGNETSHLSRAMELTLYGSILFLGVFTVALAVRRLRFVRDRLHMTRKARSGGTVVAGVTDVPAGTVKKFFLICGQHRINCFVVNVGGQFRAYINSCRHMVTPLDFVRYQFFTEDGSRLMCATHGATYEPDTGLCVYGPCKGLSLHALPVVVERGDIVVGCPAGDLSFLREMAD